ncbi:hypothetical protein BASA83_007021 [Batrachochytrium salamandrivorans]|nr:hypothetical protein BASA83_007021 [Batrachochytrium salamandrivorans]
MSHRTGGGAAGAPAWDDTQTNPNGSYQGRSRSRSHTRRAPAVMVADPLMDIPQSPSVSEILTASRGSSSNSNTLPSSSKASGGSTSYSTSSLSQSRSNNSSSEYYRNPETGIYERRPAMDSRSDMLLATRPIATIIFVAVA